MTAVRKVKVVSQKGAILKLRIIISNFIQPEEIREIHKDLIL